MYVMTRSLISVTLMYLAVNTNEIISNTTPPTRAAIKRWMSTVEKLKSIKKYKEKIYLQPYHPGITIVY